VGAVPSAASRHDERSQRLRAWGAVQGARASAALDELVRRAREVGRFSFAWISIYDGAREYVRAASGVPLAALPGEASFAAAACASGAVVEVEDASASEWSSHPWVAGGPRLRFVAVVPLTCPDGLVVGTFTVADREVRTLKAAERSAIANLATLALARLEAGDAAGEKKAPVRHDATGTSAQGADIDGALLDGVLDTLSSAFFLVDAAGRLVRWNASLAAAIGYAPGEMEGVHCADFVSLRDRAAVASALREVLEQEREISLEVEIVDRAGNVRPYAVSGKPLHHAGHPYMVGVASDITLRKRAERQMARAKERLDLALSGSRLALWDWDLAADRVYFNESWSAMLGGEPRESTFAGVDVRGWVHASDREVFAVAMGNAVKGVSDGFDCEYRVADAHGDWIWIHARGKVTQRDAEGHATRMTGTSTNVTQRKEAEERADFLATRDPLTKLPNRMLLHDRLEQALLTAARNRVGFAFMFIDLDRFKTINDSLGHDVGDELLKGVAARLTACVRATDTVARLGGDEFAVILENLGADDDEGAQHVAQKMIEAMGSPLVIGGQPLATSCSIGISLYPADGRDSATLMKNADVAMYYAKEKGRNNFQFFSAGMNARAQERLSVESYLRLALRRNELLLHFQPRMRLAERTLVGVEALVRWQHPRRGLLPPAKFIEVAEDSGLIVPIGEWALAEACRQVGEWRLRTGSRVRLAVNISAGQLRDGERLLRAVTAAIAQPGMDASGLELEITESHLMQDIEEKAKLFDRIGELGVRIAIDDFGTGYSSLSYLKKLPVDAIKIDSSFVRDIEEDPNDEAIIRAILAMAHSLKLSVVAEGVERPAQYLALKALGCDEYQGFFESPPLSAEEFERRYAGAAQVQP
jgi:diguanylate cyclase (GGDEF)-like protein/PAS domain S-box-containing protein